MVYAPQYEHDVCVCFADVDNAILPGGRQGWIEQLVECLTKLLEERGIGQPSIRAFLEGNVPAGERLARLHGAATLVVVLSPAYLESEWCVRDDLVQAIRSIGDARPDSVFVVDKAPIDRRRATDYDDFRHDDFWVSIRNGSRPLGIPDLRSSGDTSAYYDVVSGLAEAVSRRLKQLVAPEAARPGEALGRKVFLAEATEDVKNQRSSVQRFLEQAGLEVVPRGRLALAPDQLDHQMRDMLAGCRAFVQLLGDGSAPGGERTQAQLAVALSLDGELPILQWRDAALDLSRVVSAEHRELLLRDTVRAETISDFCHAVRSCAMRVDPPPAERPTVFVDTHPQQVDDVERIFRRYATVQWDWHQPSMKTLKTVLRTVDGVIIYWGSGDSTRTQERYYIFRTQFKALKKKLERLLIYDGPPEGKPRFHGSNFPVADGRDGREPAMLRDFLREIAHAG